MKIKTQIHFVATDPRTDPWVVKKLDKSKGEKDYFLSLKIIQIDNTDIKSTQDFFNAVKGYFPKIIAGNRLLNDLFVNVTLPPGAEDITHITLGNFPDFRMDRDTKNDIDTLKVKRAESLQNEIVEFDISPDDFELVTTCDVSEICDVSKISLSSGKITKAGTVGFNRDAVLNIKPSLQIQEQLKSQSKKVFGDDFELWNAQKQAVPYHITIAQTNQFSKTLHQIEASSKIERLSISINSLKTDEKYTEELKRRDQNKLSEMNADNFLEKLKDLQDALFQIVMQRCGADHSHIGIYVTRESSRMRMLGDFFKKGLFDLLYNLFTAERGLIIHNWNNLTSEKYHIPCILLALEAEKKDLVNFLLKNECDLKLSGALSKLIEAMKNKGYLKDDDAEKLRIKRDSKEGSLITANEIISAIQWKPIDNMPLPTTSPLTDNPISFFAKPQIKGAFLSNEKPSTTVSEEKDYLNRLFRKYWTTDKSSINLDKDGVDDLWAYPDAFIWKFHYECEGFGNEEALKFRKFLLVRGIKELVDKGLLNGGDLKTCRHLDITQAEQLVEIYNENKEVWKSIGSPKLINIIFKGENGYVVATKEKARVIAKKSIDNYRICCNT